MKKTKLSELFAFENFINENTNRTQLLVWNNRTMLIAEENSLLICDKELTVDELTQGVIDKDEGAVNTLLYAAIASGYEDYSINDFLDYYDSAEYSSYYLAVLEGVSNYLPDRELREELAAVNEAITSAETVTPDEYDHWASLYYFCKKNLLMSDKEFLNSTWRKIAILQREFGKTLPDYQKNKTVTADELNFI